MEPKRKAVAPLILSIISAVSAFAAIVCALLFMYALKYDAGTSGDYITNEVLLFAFEFFFYLYLALGAAIEGFVTGLIGLILTIKRKRISLIWLPILALSGCILSVVILCLAFPH